MNNLVLRWTGDLATTELLNNGHPVLACYLKVEISTPEETPGLQHGGLFGGQLILTEAPHQTHAIFPGTVRIEIPGILYQRAAQVIEIRNFDPDQDPLATEFWIDGVDRGGWLRWFDLEINALEPHNVTVGCSLSEYVVQETQVF
jgi:hypothetical protein